MRVLLLTALFASPALAEGPRDAPRATEFPSVPDYAELQPDRHGTPARPMPNELGAWAVIQTFRATCLSIENGASLAEALPPGFAAWQSGPFFFAEAVPAETGSLALSPTGDIDADDAAGTPILSLSPAPTGMTCRIEWNPVGETRLDAVPGMVQEWLPFAMAMVRANRPAMTDIPPPVDSAEWDRPCNDRWCPVTATYSVSGRPMLSLETTLDITDIGGTRP